MPSRNATSDHTHNRPRSSMARTKLDWAIIASLLAMGALNLFVMADQFGAPKAYAATPVCGVPLA